MTRQAKEGGEIAAVSLFRRAGTYLLEESARENLRLESLKGRRLP